MESKQLIKKELLFTESTQKEIFKEKIVFVELSILNKSLIMISSINNIILCSILNDSIQILKKLVNIINNVETKINIISCYFCNEDEDSLLILCDDLNIYEYSIRREYISHIYYNSLANSFLFKMNCQKNPNPENGIRNFTILKNGEIKTWNSLPYNKNAILKEYDIKCFSYDLTGVVLYLIGQKEKVNYYLSIIKFVSEYETKEIYFKTLEFLEPKCDISYLDIFDNNIIMFDKNSGNILILKNYPINNYEIKINLKDENKITPFLLPFNWNNSLYEFGILYNNFNENSNKIFHINYRTKQYKEKITNLEINTLYCFKEKSSTQSILFVLDEDKRGLKQYILSND